MWWLCDIVYMSFCYHGNFENSIFYCWMTSKTIYSSYRNYFIDLQVFILSQKTMKKKSRCTYYILIYSSPKCNRILTKIAKENANCTKDFCLDYFSKYGSICMASSIACWKYNKKISYTSKTILYLYPRLIYNFPTMKTKKKIFSTLYARIIYSHNHGGVLVIF